MIKPGEALFMFVTLSVTFSYATPFAWWTDAWILLCLLAIGTCVNVREERRKI